jgi:lactoylglutathione lyase
MSVRALGFNHVAFEVVDLDEALTWYQRYFDFELRGRRGGMAWIDLGDQFLALSESGAAAADRDRHVGFVVDDKEALRDELIRDRVPVSRAGALRVRDPSGNQLEIVDYRDIQYTKAPAVLRAMSSEGLSKRQSALDELDAKGMLEAASPSEQPSAGTA